MEERVHHLGGAFEVKSEPGHGTLLTVELPVNHSHESDTHPASR
jgi:signal transduction histidine kinase